MPILFIITAISDNYFDIAVNPNRYYLKLEFLFLSAFLTLWASRPNLPQSHYIGFVAARVRLGRLAEYTPDSAYQASWATSLTLQHPTRPNHLTCE